MEHSARFRNAGVEESPVRKYHMTLEKTASEVRHILIYYQFTSLARVSDEVTNRQEKMNIPSVVLCSELRVVHVMELDNCPTMQGAHIISHHVRMPSCVESGHGGLVSNFVELIHVLRSPRLSAMSRTMFCKPFC